MQALNSKINPWYQKIFIPRPIYLIFIKLDLEDEEQWAMTMLCEQVFKKPSEKEMNTISAPQVLFFNYTV